MRTFCIISFLVIALYHLTSPPTAAGATSVPTSLNEDKHSINEKQPMRGSMRGLMSSYLANSNLPKKPEKNKVVDIGGMERTSHIEKGVVLAAGEETDVGDDGEGLIYNVDYHGVTTHPPSPKHPHP